MQVPRLNVAFVVDIVVLVVDGRGDEAGTSEEAGHEIPRFPKTVDCLVIFEEVRSGDVSLDLV